MAPTGGRRPRPGLLAWTAGQHHRKRFLESQALEPPPRAFSQQVWSGLCWAWGQEAGASLRQEKALLFIPLTVSKWGGGGRKEVQKPLLGRDVYNSYQTFEKTRSNKEVKAGDN